MEQSIFQQISELLGVAPSCPASGKPRPLPGQALSRPLRRLFTEENGSRQEGEVLADDLAPAGKTELDGKRYVAQQLVALELPACRLASAAGGGE